MKKLMIVLASLAFMLSFTAKSSARVIIEPLPVSEYEADYGGVYNGETVIVPFIRTSDGAIEIHPVSFTAISGNIRFENGVEGCVTLYGSGYFKFLHVVSSPREVVKVTISGYFRSGSSGELDLEINDPNNPDPAV
ncbi:MAG: hypothetical protein LBG19_09255 [Prevotellaceae bacterium]|jgi:hypothetical protein|nr:hypothetical protein [Prevotellaceae bacterium]